MIAGFYHYTLLLFSLMAFYPGRIDHEYSSRIMNTHPLYVAVVEIEYNIGDKFATLLCRTFPDDLQLALQKQYSKKESIDNPGDPKKLALEIDGYIKSHLQLKINGRQYNLVFINYKKDDEAVSINFRINNIDNIQNVEIADNIFYELYNKQINIIYVTVNGNHKSKQLSNPVSEAKFEF